MAPRTAALSTLLALVSYGGRRFDATVGERRGERFVIPHPLTDTSERGEARPKEKEWTSLHAPLLQPSGCCHLHVRRGLWVRWAARQRGFGTELEPRVTLQYRLGGVRVLRNVGLSGRWDCGLVRGRDRHDDGAAFGSGGGHRSAQWLLRVRAFGQLLRVVAPE